MIKKITLALFGILASCSITAQEVHLSQDKIIALTSSWKGERFADGRPKVSDALLRRLKKIQIEEAWGYLRSKKLSQSIRRELGNNTPGQCNDRSCGNRPVYAFASGLPALN